MRELFSLHHSPVFLRREALEHGYDDNSLRAARAAGLLHRIRHGAYADATVWAAATPEQRHLLHADAVVLAHEGRLALSHTTAAVNHGLALYEPDLRRVHVLCLDEAVGRTHSDVVYHQPGVTPADGVTEVASRLSVPATRAALEAATLTDVAHGLVILDSALHLNHTTLDDLRAAHTAMLGHPGTRKLQLTVRMARVGSESVGESLGRYLMWRYHLPEPELQVEVRDDDGHLVARLDWTWRRHELFGEFDGAQKYSTLLREGETPADAVIREKQREDLVRELTGWRAFRMTWADLQTPELTAARLRRQLAPRRRRAA